MSKTKLFSRVVWLPLAVGVAGGLTGCNNGGQTDDTDSECIGITCPGHDPDDTDVEDTDDTDRPDTDLPDTDVPDTDVPDTDVPDTDVPDTDDTDTGDTWNPDTDTNPPDTDTGDTDTAKPTDTDPPDGTKLEPNDIVVTEVMVTPSFDDCQNEDYGEYVEIKNTTDHVVNLQFVVIRYASTRSSIQTRILLQPGAYAIGRPNVTACAGYQPSFHADFTYSPSINFSTAGNNSTLTLQTSTAITLDTVNFALWQFGPPPERFTRGYSVHLQAGFENAGSNDTPANWCLADELLGIDLPGKTASRGTPGRVARGCTPVPSNDTDTGGGGDTDTDTDGGVVDPIKPGDLVINEVNLNPLGCPNPEDGRYIEIYNNTDREVDLRDYKLDWGSIKDLSIGKQRGTTWLLGPREYTSIQRASASGCYSYGNRFTVNNALSPTGKKVVLHTASTPSVTVDEVDMSSWVFPAGRSLGFDPDALASTPFLNPLRALWCPQQSYIAGGVRDHGTPNEPNNSCSGGGGSDTDTDPPVVDPCFTSLGRNVNNGLDADELCRGELIITELHLDPQDCGQNAAQGQYLELYNASGYVIHLRSGLLIDIGAGTAQDIEPIGGAATDVAPGQFIAVHQKQFQAYCHDFPHRFDLASSGVDFEPTTITIQNGQLTEIDRVDFTGWDFQAGVARQLMPEIPLVLSPNYDLASFNDDPSLWCTDGPIMSPLGSLDRGTPAAANDCAGETVTDTDGGDDTFVDPPHDPRNLADGISPEELYEGELVITEVMVDPLGCGGGTHARYLELYNSTNTVMHLNGLQVAIGGNTAGSLVKTGTSDDLPGGGYATIALSSQYAFCFPSAAPKWEIAGATLDASRVRLFNSTVPIIDAVDFTGWQFTHGRSLQFDPIVTPNFASNNLQERWCDSADAISGSLTDFGSPGSPGNCWNGEDEGPPVLPDTVTLNQLPRDTTTLMISEIMTNPHCADSRGEYVEVYNTFDHDVDLFGLRMRLSSFAPATVVTEHRIIPRSGYATLARSNAARCYVTSPTSGYPSNWEMIDIGDRITLSFTDSGGFTVVLDEVQTLGWKVPPTGQSLQLNATVLNNLANNFETAWCPTPAVSIYNLTPSDPTLLDFGTPGRANDGCQVLCDTGDTSCFIPDTDVPDTDIPVEPDRPLPGELVITEFMAQPGDCSPDATAEYIEVYNTTLKPLSLRYLTVNDEEGLATTQFESVVQSHAYAVLVNVRAGTTQCYGLDSTAWYDGAVLNNNGDVITLTNEAGQVIDRVDFNTFPSAFGASWELGTGMALTAAGNDAPANWCTSTKAIATGVGDRGTPGTANSCTPPSVTPPTCPTDPNSNIKGACELVPGDLVITEIMANSAEPLKPNDPATEWVEVYNASGQTVNLRGVEIANRFGALATSTIQDDVFIPANRRAVLARFHAGGRLYGASASAMYTRPLFDNQGDIVQVRVGSTLIDQVDFRTWPDERPGEALSLSGEFLTATSNDTSWAWCPAITPIPGAQRDLGTPGTANPRCASLVVDTSSPPEGPVDADTLVDPEYPDTDSWVPTGTPLNLGQLVPADLVITELMIDPIDCTDGAAEYIEIRNNRSVDVDLNGLKITTTSGTFTLGRSVVVGPHRFALGVPGGVVNCYDLPADFTYTGLKLVNVSDTVTIAGPSFAFDTVNTSTFPVRTTGASWSLDPAAFTSSLNDVGSNWCPSPDVIPGGEIDRGTPGYANGLCITTFDPDTQPQDTFDTFTPSPDPAKLIDDVKVGELLITEIMVDPRDCADEDAEYVEVYNNGTQPIDLNGLVVSDGTRSYTVAALADHLVIQPGDYYLARRSAVNECYTLRTRFRYASVVFGQPQGMAFIGSESHVIDLVDFGEFAPAPGHAFTLDPAKVAATPPTSAAGDSPESVIDFGTYSSVYLHNRAADWCSGWQRFSGALGDKGSPGRPNDACLGEGELPPYPPGYVANIEELDPNDLAITEFMADPKACPDLYGEYVELRNNYAFAVDLFGLHVRTGETDTAVTVHQIVQPGALALVRKVGGTSACYFGVNADVITNFVLTAYGTAKDKVALANSHSTLDLVDYSQFTVRAGSSFSVTTGHETAVDNNDELNWCFEAATIAGTADHGSPGRANGLCAAPAFVRNIASLSAGDLVISEVMLSAHDCPETLENYIEVTNTTDATVDLIGLRVALQGGSGPVGGSSFTVDESVVVGPGKRGVLSHAVGCLANHLNEDFHWTYPGLQYLGEPIVLEDPSSSTVFDAIDTSRWTIFWTSPDDAHAFQVMPDRVNAAANDNVANWCKAKVRIRGTNTGGTPGEVNDCVTDNLSEVVVDTSTEVDTDLAPADTDMFRIAQVSGDVMVSPNSLWQGTTSRRSYIGTADDLNEDNTTGTVFCYLRYNTHQVRALPTAALCPSCEFGFEIAMDTRTDLRPFYTGGLQSDLTACGDVFAPVGGVPRLPQNKMMFYSSLYGAVYYLDAAGALVRYSDLSELSANGRLVYYKYLYRLPY